MSNGASGSAWSRNEKERVVNEGCDGGGVKAWQGNGKGEGEQQRSEMARFAQVAVIKCKYCVLRAWRN